MGGQLLQGHGLTAVFDKNIFRGIVHLFGAGCPSAIVLAIGLVIVIPFYRVTVWACSHVSQECLEVIDPLGAHNDPPTSISVKLNVPSIVAALFHSNPGVVLTLTHAPNVLIGLIFGKTPATVRSPALQVARTNFTHRSAVAPTDPLHLFNLRRSSNNRPTSEALPGTINKVSARSFCDRHTHPN